MSGIQIAEAKAPWVMFERRAEEDRNASIEAGKFIAKNVDYALITPHGSKDQIERVVKDWFDMLEGEVKQGRFPAEWAKAYKSAYNDWVEGKETPLHGTAIINWPVVSPAQVRLLQDLHILTVENLAVANEEVIRRLGMGGRALVDKAKDFLSAATGPGKLSEEIGAMRAQLEQLVATNKALQEQNQALSTLVNAGKAAGSPSEVREFAGGLIDDEPAPARKL